MLATEKQNVVIRASIGAVLCLPRTYPQPATEVLDAADRAMYTAKATGKNQITFVSLINDADVQFLDDVEQMRFGTWLSKWGSGIPSPLTLELGRSGSRFEAPGRLARRLGWLTPAQLRHLLREQRRNGKRFDEIARARGLLTAEQLSALLALQLETPEELAQALVKQGVVSESVMRENLRNYYQWLRASLVR